MSDYLSDIVTKTIGNADLILPRRPSRFETAQTTFPLPESEPSPQTDLVEEVRFVEATPPARRQHVPRDTRRDAISDAVGNDDYPTEQTEGSSRDLRPEPRPLRIDTDDVRATVTPRPIEPQPVADDGQFPVFEFSPKTVSRALPAPNPAFEPEVSVNRHERPPIETTIGPVRETNKIESSTTNPPERRTVETHEKIIIEPRVEKTEKRVEQTAIHQTVISPTREPVSEQMQRPAEFSEAPTINVSIGRVEIRAAIASAPPRPSQSKPQTLSLDEYLRKRRTGGNR